MLSSCKEVNELTMDEEGSYIDKRMTLKQDGDGKRDTRIEPTWKTALEKNGFEADFRIKATLKTACMKRMMNV